MNYFVIYQLFVQFREEKHLAVCKNQAENGEDSKKIFGRNSSK